MLKKRINLQIISASLLLGLFAGSTYASVTSQAIIRGQACINTALEIIADEKELAFDEIASNPSTVNAAQTASITYLYGIGDDTGANALYVGKGNNSHHYIWVSLGNNCGCYTGQTVVAELRSGSTVVTAASDVGLLSLHQAVALCSKVVSTTAGVHSLVPATDDIQCSGSKTNTVYFAQTGSADDSDVKIINSASNADALCASAALATLSDT